MWFATPVKDAEFHQGQCEVRETNKQSSEIFGNKEQTESHCKWLADRSEIESQSDDSVS